ncbi:ATP-binding cassette domain-containing protein [Natronoglycomyces albus]|uniref:ATP-binding cassette domain-containing protein n=1 Tax=Natronoglycomyces albus TaxID=2811108 RepID=UPI001FE77F6A|nr:ATP-binding cassette domain-containing protein [Natronoglycomyces albus]
MQAHETVVRAEGLTKSFKGTTALKEFNLAVAAGTVHGLLGPNGAGKSTAVRLLATLLAPDAGRATIAGFDIVKDAYNVRRHIGLVGQSTAIDEEMTGRQNLEMFGRLYHLGAKRARQRAAELLERFDLVSAADRGAQTYSGGMRRRLDLAAAMIMAPTVLFLDEPSTGLDPRSRNEVWQAVRDLVAAGTTVLLTTQYLEEADQLADHISLLASPGDEGGRVIAEGTPSTLKEIIGQDRLDVVVRRHDDLAAAEAIVRQVAGTQVEVQAHNRMLSAPVADRMRALSQALRDLEENDIDVEDIGLRRPTLDEVFLHLTAATQGAQ